MVFWVKPGVPSINFRKSKNATQTLVHAGAHGSRVIVLTNFYSKNPEIFQSIFKTFDDVIPARHLGVFAKRNVETQHPFDSVTAWAPPLATPGVRD